VVVLKGRGSIITDGERLFVNETGNAGMATGGTGDVLTGMIAALIGQRLPALEAAILAVYLHGLAGDFAAEELGRRSMTAMDLIEYLPEAFCDHELSGSE
jgi:NAD(P)H-hydrate epimerase